MTTIDRVLIRDYLNQFSDRWPDVYYKMGWSISRQIPYTFEIAVLQAWNWWAKENVIEVKNLIRKMRAHQFIQEEEVRVQEEEDRRHEKFKVKIEEIECGGEL